MYTEATKRATTKLRVNRKSENKCVDCGKELDRSGARCISCNDKQNAYNRMLRQSYIENKVCPVCRVNSLKGSEHSCPECRAKKAEEKLRYKAKHIDHIREHNREYYRIKREIYLSDDSVCNRCGKPNYDSRYKQCPRCRDRARIVDHARRPGKLGYQKDRYKIGLCYFCNEPILPGKKVCQIHYDRIVYMNRHKSKESMKWGEFKIR